MGGITYMYILHSKSTTKPESQVTKVTKIVDLKSKQIKIKVDKSIMFATDYDMKAC